jgi:hypothetical protein
MKRLGILMVLLFSQVSFAPVVSASDFDWLNNLNIKAEADSSGFRVQLATRFRIGDADVKIVLDEMGKKSDAYMVLRLGELSHRPIDEVMSVYNANRKKGWGVIAKKLGIKPGSREFHALKRGHDLNGGMGKERGQSFGKGKDKGKGKNKNKGKNK